MLVPLVRVSPWSLYEKFYKFDLNTFPNNTRMKIRIDLDIGKVVISIIYHIADSWLFYWLVTIFIFGLVPTPSLLYSRFRDTKQHE